MTSRSLLESEKAYFDWVNVPDVQKIMGALEAVKPGGARFVGGCVRDSLMKAPAADIDVATQLLPTDTIDALRAAKIRAVPTGLDHGTVTAIEGKTVIEITTLRSDVSTDGRRASIAYTDDWAEDAIRRDFTINAFYLDRSGMLYDYTDGLADLADKKIRFIGDAEQRIREDYLRILRFYRFSARFSNHFDSHGHVACSLRAAGLGKISRERIGSELIKILSLRRAAKAIAAMDGAGILNYIWRDVPDIATLRFAINLAEQQPDPEVALAALWPEADESFGDALKLSSKQNKRRLAALAAEKALMDRPGEDQARKLLYTHGQPAYADGVLLAWARASASGQRAGDRIWPQLLSVPGRWEVPIFPVTGKALQKSGVAPGPALGEKLRLLEQRWIEDGFPMDADYLKF